MERKFPRKIKRVVIKVGSSLLATHMMKPHERSLKSLVAQICDLQDRGFEVVFVSSGAIALGLGEMGERVRPSDTPSLQAAAAVGQALLMRLYGDLFKKRGRVCAQILLTWDDFDSKLRHSNACNTLQKLLTRGVVPIINENDSISTEEIKFGDNDKLSAMVAAMVHADLLIMLSDVDGLYKKEGGKLTEKFSEVREITDEIRSVAGGARDHNFSKGGMVTKVNAVEIASRAAVPCIIANGQTMDVIRRIVVDKESLGTYFFEKEERLIAHKHWICFFAKPKGFVTVDDGAAKAILKGDASLLLPGIVAWGGKFTPGDAVVVQDQAGVELARGIADYAKEHLDEVSDRKAKKPFIHIDNLVVTA